MSQLEKEVFDRVDRPIGNDEEDDHSSKRGSSKANVHNNEIDELISILRVTNNQSSKVTTSPIQGDDQKNAEDELTTSPPEVNGYNNDKEELRTDPGPSDDDNSDKDELTTNHSQADDEKLAEDRYVTSPSEADDHNNDKEELRTNPSPANEQNSKEDENITSSINLNYQNNGDYLDYEAKVKIMIQMITTIKMKQLLSMQKQFVTEVLVGKPLMVDLLNLKHRRTTQSNLILTISLHVLMTMKMS